MFTGPCKNVKVSQIHMEALDFYTCSGASCPVSFLGRQPQYRSALIIQQTCTAPTAVAPCGIDLCPARLRCSSRQAAEVSHCCKASSNREGHTEVPLLKRLSFLWATGGEVGCMASLSMNFCFLFLWFTYSLGALLFFSIGCLSSLLRKAIVR